MVVKKTLISMFCNKTFDGMVFKKTSYRDLLYKAILPNIAAQHGANTVQKVGYADSML